MRGNTRLETETGTHKPLIAGSNPAGATSSGFLLLLRRRLLYFFRLCYRFIAAWTRIVAPAGTTHVRDLLAYVIPKLYQLVHSFAITDSPRNAQWFKSSLFT